MRVHTLSQEYALHRYRLYACFKYTYTPGGSSMSLHAGTPFQQTLLTTYTVYNAQTPNNKYTYNERMHL
jgi:hypothetical protein